MDTRDQIWNTIFDVYYDSYYYELLSNRMVAKWLKWDEFSRVLMAVTASGSAISGLAL